MKVKVRYKDKISEVFADPEQITSALVHGVREALLKHKQAGNPVVVWRNGKTVWRKLDKISARKT